MHDSPSNSRELLREAEWVRELPEVARERVMQDSVERWFDEGDAVARRGEVADSWIGVAEGLLKISAVYRSGRTVMFTGIPEGSWVGEGSVIKRELRRYDIIAMRRSRVVSIPGATFRWLLDTNVGFAHHMISRLNERLGQYIAMVELDRMGDHVARVARMIGALYNPILYPQMSTLLSLSQTELGELAGVHRHSVAATLKQLESEGLISTRYGGLLVRNLARIVDYPERDTAKWSGSELGEVRMVGIRHTEGR